jgi:PAS domain S-box-containing protein
MFALSPAETIAVLTAAFLSGALFGRVIWRRRAYDARVRTVTDAARRAAEERFRLVQDASPDGFALFRSVHGAAGTIVDFEFAYLNPASERITGRAPESLVGRRLTEETPSLAPPHLLAAYAAVAVTGKPYRLEHQLPTQAEARWVAFTAVQIDDGVAVSFTDVTARKQGESLLAASNAELEHRVAQRTAELQEARERYRLLAEHASDMISTHATDGTFLYAAPALESLLGATTAELHGRSPKEFAFPDDAPLLGEMLQRSSETSGAALVTWRCRRIDGSYVWLETSLRAVRDAKTSQALWYVSASRDVTARKRIEDALRESERRLRATLEAAHLVAVALDTEGMVTFCNDAMCTLAGWTRNALIGRSWFDVCIPALEGDAARAAFREQIARAEVPTRGESEIVCRDGKRRLIEWDNSVLRDLAGTVVGTVSLGVDVTEKRQEETALQLLQSVTVAASAAEDIDAAVAVTLQSICEATRWSYGELWLPDADRTRLFRHGVWYSTPGLEVKGGGLAVRSEELSISADEGLPGRAWKSGRLVWVPDLNEQTDAIHEPQAADSRFHAAAAVPVRSGREVVGVLCFFLEQAQRSDARAAEVVAAVANQLGSLVLRKRAETELRESEARLRAVVRSMNEGLVITDLDDRIQFVNERLVELTGCGERELLGRASSEIFAPFDEMQGADRLARRRRGQSDRYEVRHAREGRSAVWLEISGGPLANADGEVVGTLGTVTDVSERKRYEEAILRARDAAEAASRAKSGFLSRMSHELRTPLNSVIGFARVLRKNAGGRFVAEDLTYLDRIRANGEHLLDIVNDLLDVAKIEAGRVAVEVGRVRLDELVRGIVEQLEGQPRGAGVELRAEVPAEPVAMETDATLLRQVLINLAGNALRFTHAGHVVVRLHVDPATRAPIRIDVADTGIGIPSDRQRAIFEPFEQADSTTSRAYGGTGLGLSIARSLCDALGYALSLESTPGQGSTFTVHLDGAGARRRTGAAA